jgi:ribosome maturation factor RimP
MSSTKRHELETLLKPIATRLGFELLGLEFIPSKGNALLRIYIEHPARPIVVDDCEIVSREVSATLDVNDPIQSNYRLEVSSPGFDRPFFSAQQMSRFIGEQVKLNTDLPIGGRRRFNGPIIAVKGEIVTIECDSQNYDIPFASVEKARLHTIFVPPPLPGKKPGVKTRGVKPS